MMMRYVYNEDGFYTESVTSDELVENSTSVSPIGVITPKIEFPGDPDSNWIDGRTPDEIKDWKAYQVEQIQEKYDGLISKLLSKHIGKFFIAETPIPEEIKAEGQRLIDECNLLISEIDSDGDEYK
ncbi:hypothetical protein [Flavobacterium sp. CAU 1735]|uniref:hypothetical protein n=1 Tax=Flavobacterium sp. CAU 1735 TaxID=3140361 RepID=UPI0032601585